MTLCKCGCGGETKPGNIFIMGHQNRGRTRPVYPDICFGCGVALDDNNWNPSAREQKKRICKTCNRECSEQIRRKNGGLSMSKNKECASYLGIHVNERLLKHLFNDVEVMPMNNPGYDFICNNGKKIDGKSSCLTKDGRWMFNIRHNTIPDYFLCVAYDNRIDLNILHIWLLPGDKFNHLTGTGISKSTIHKWSEYEQPIDKAITCCDSMKSKQ